MWEIGSKERRLPAPPSVVWESLVDPHRSGTRPWLGLLAREVEPRTVRAERHTSVVWSSLWSDRPDDQIHFDLVDVGGETSLRFTLLTPKEASDEGASRQLRRRISRLVFGELRYSYGQ